MSCSFVTDPWEHVIAAGIGIAFANGVVQFEAKTAADLEQSIEQAKSAQKRRFIGQYEKPCMVLNSPLHFNLRESRCLPCPVPRVCVIVCSLPDRIPFVSLRDFQAQCEQTLNMAALPSSNYILFTQHLQTISQLGSDIGSSAKANHSSASP